MAEFAHAELVTAGARPRRLTFSGAESLTASERRVSEMAAEGQTNREVAQALFVTQKTVENHLSHAYSKLADTTRWLLPRSGRRRGLRSPSARRRGAWTMRSLTRSGA